MKVIELIENETGGFKVIKYLSTVLVLIIFCNQVFAAEEATTTPVSQIETSTEEISVEEPTLRGEGCSDENTGVSITPDKKTISFIFDNFISESGKTLQLRRSYTRCQITLPLKVPRGWQVALVKLEQRGFYALPEKTSARLKTTYSFTSGRGRWQHVFVKNRSIRGPAEADFVFESEMKSKPVYSRCGKQIQLRMDMEVSTKTNRAGDDVVFALDSVDAAVDNKSRSGLHLLWRKCS